MSYRITDMNVNYNRDYNSINTVGGSISMVPEGTTTVSLNIEMSDDITTIHTIAEFEEYLRGNYHPWADTEMIEKALQEMYPEKYL